jgi:hypothetical protein
MELTNNEHKLTLELSKDAQSWGGWSYVFYAGSMLCLFVFLRYLDTATRLGEQKQIGSFLVLGLLSLHTGLAASRRKRVGRLVVKLMSELKKRE